MRFIQSPSFVGYGLKRHSVLHPTAAAGGVLDSGMVRLHGKMAVPFVGMVLHDTLRPVLCHFSRKHTIFQLLLQANQLLDIQLV